MSSGFGFSTSSTFRFSKSFLPISTNPTKPYHSHINIRTHALPHCLPHVFTNKIKHSVLTRSLSSKPSSSSPLSQPPQDTQNQCSHDVECDRDLQRILTVAKEAAIQAGEIMKRTSGQIQILSTKSKANAADLVTASDVECQSVIRNVILENFPNDFFLGEEDVDPGSVASVNALEDILVESSSSSSNLDGEQKEKKPLERDDESSNKVDAEERLVWIVDPIDGTTNFQAGLPIFCASIGVLSPTTKEILVGVIYNPILNEMTTAIRNEGCFLNGKPLNIQTTTTTTTQQQQQQEQEQNLELPLSQSVINIGFPVVQKSTLLVSSRAITALCTKVRRIRMMACASQVMAWVAQGKLQAYVSWDLNAWDIAAGMLIVKEAGGDVYDMKNGRGDAGVEARDMVVTSMGGLKMRKELLDILEENDCLSY